MLEIVIPQQEMFNNETNTFKVTFKETTICLEHSLVSISKWESKWHKSFLSKNQKTNEEIIDYIKCMTITQNVNNEVYSHLTQENLLKINAYIEDSMSATTFSSYRKTSTQSRETLTSELIYYWMVSYNIPFKCEKWHLNRLLTLIRICNIKSNASNNTMSKKDLATNNAALNAARKARLKTNG